MDRLRHHTQLLGLCGSAPLDLQDSFQHRVLHAEGSALTLDGQPLKTHRALLTHLMPSPDLNLAGLLSGTLLTPLGTLSFHIEERRPKFTQELVVCLTLVNLPQRPVIFGDRTRDFLQLIWTERPIGNHALPCVCCANSDPGLHATTGMFAQMHRVREAAVGALVTPQARHAARRVTLQMQLQAAEAAEHLAAERHEQWRRVLREAGVEA